MPRRRDKPEDWDAHIGRAIRIMRRNAGMSQTALGAPTVPQKVVSKIERGVQRLTLLDACRIARNLGLPVSALITEPAP